MLLEARHEDGSPMSDQELRDELMTLLVAGHETTASTLAWAFSQLPHHPEVLATSPRRSARATTATTSTPPSTRRCATGRCCPNIQPR